jgi:hypothetical protein
MFFRAYVTPPSQRFCKHEDRERIGRAEVRRTEDRRQKTVNYRRFAPQILLSSVFDPPSSGEATKTHAAGGGVFVGFGGFEGGLRLPSNLKYSRPKVGFYFWTFIQ